MKKRRKRKKYDLDKKFVQFLRREWWFRSEDRKLALELAKFMYEKEAFICARCRKVFEKVVVDHIIPVGRPKSKGKLNWNLFRDRLFCSATKLQVLCLKCHNTKTQEEGET